MTTLVQHSQLLGDKIKSLAQAKSLAEDLKHIQQRTTEWQDCHSNLVALREQTALLVLSDDDVLTIANKEHTFKQNAKTILSRLLANENVKELTRDAAWTRLLKSCTGFAEQLDAAGRKAWQTHLDHLGKLETPSALRLRTPSMPSNDQALKDYQESYSAYLAIARLVLPRSKDDLLQVSVHLDSCRKTFARLTFDLPNEVKEFYNAINKGTATLADVTPTVTNWLNENGQLESFQVRIAGK